MKIKEEKKRLHDGWFFITNSIQVIFFFLQLLIHQRKYVSTLIYLLQYYMNSFTYLLSFEL